MDGWMEQRALREKQEREGGWMDRLIDGWMDGWIWRLMDEWMDVDSSIWKDSWIDRWVDR